MIVVQLVGGLGNQLFQYAAAKALAIEKNKKLLLDISRFTDYKLHNYGLIHFNIDAKDFKQPNKYINKLKSLFFSTTNYQEVAFNYNPEVFQLQADTIYLKGYFQSEKYFDKQNYIIRENLQIISKYKPQTVAALYEIQMVNSVSIHIRRGDYLSNKVHNTSKEEYYKEALAFVLSKIKNPVFYIFSDDMKWVKENFKLNHATVYIDFNDASTNFEDMKLMSACKHNIIANSSFSWWSAWLNSNPDKMVVAPKQWFNDDIRNTSDIIPESWITI